MAHSHVRFQIDPASVPSIPSWMEEGAAVAHILTQTGIISAIEDHVQCALSRFLAALDEKTIEALRTQFLQDLLERATPFSSLGGLWEWLGTFGGSGNGDSREEVRHACLEDRVFDCSSLPIRRLMILLKSDESATAWCTNSLSARCLPLR